MKSVYLGEFKVSRPIDGLSSFWEVDEVVEELPGIILPFLLFVALYKYC